MKAGKYRPYSAFTQAVRLLRVTNRLKFYPRLRKRLIAEAFNLIDGMCK